MHLSHLHRKQKPISYCVNFFSVWEDADFPCVHVPTVLVCVCVFTDCNDTHGCPSERTSDVSPSFLPYLSFGASVPSALHRAVHARSTHLSIATATGATASKLKHMLSWTDCKRKQGWRRRGRGKIIRWDVMKHGERIKDKRRRRI